LRCEQFEPPGANGRERNGEPRPCGASGNFADPGPSAWFDRTAYAAPAQYTFGTAGRNQLRSDRLDSLDFALFREDPWTERLRSQLRLELFNALNHVSFGTPQLLLSSPAFPQVSSTVSGARQMQLALKLIF